MPQKGAEKDKGNSDEQKDIQKESISEFAKVKDWIGPKRCIEYNKKASSINVILLKLIYLFISPTLGEQGLFKFQTT